MRPTPARASRRRARDAASRTATPDGAAIRDADVLARIRALAIPPAWTDVWICPRPTRPPPGHGPRRPRSQAVPLPRRAGASARGDASSTGCSPSPRRCRAIRAPVRRATWRRRGLPREKVLAAVVRLLELTLIRVGNEEYARLNRLVRADDAARPPRARRRARRSASGSAASPARRHEVGLRDRRLAAIVRRCQDLPGQDLFQYVDEDGEVRDVALRGRQRLPARGPAADVHGQGLPDLGGHRPGVSRAAGAPAGRRRPDGPTQRRRGDPSDRRAPGQYAGGRARELCPPGRARGLPRRRARRRARRGGRGAGRAPAGHGRGGGGASSTSCASGSSWMRHGRRAAPGAARADRGRAGPAA